MKKTLVLMKNSHINWEFLLESTDIRRWAKDELSTSELRALISGKVKEEFDNMLRSRGTNAGKRLARKTMKYRGLL